MRVKLFQRVRELGFAGIEWSPRWLDYDRATDEQLHSLRQEVNDCGLEISALNLNRFILSHCAQAADHQRRLMRSINVAPVLGAESVIVSLSMPEPPTAERPRLLGCSISAEEFASVVSMLRAAAGRAYSQGVNLVLELHDDGLLDSAERCLRMLDAIDHGCVRVNPDLGNLIRNGDAAETWRHALRQLAPVTGYWHVKNYLAGQPVPIWEGEIDYAEALAIMRTHRYDGWVSIESYAAADVMSLQHQSLQWLKRWDAKAKA